MIINTFFLQLFIIMELNQHNSFLDQQVISPQWKGKFSSTRQPDEFKEETPPVSISQLQRQFKNHLKPKSPSPPRGRTLKKSPGKQLLHGREKDNNQNSNQNSLRLQDKFMKLNMDVQDFTCGVMEDDLGSLSDEEDMEDVGVFTDQHLQQVQKSMVNREVKPPIPTKPAQITSKTTEKKEMTSFSLRNLVKKDENRPLQTVKINGQTKKIKIVKTVSEAIGKSNLIRIRSGSPGIRAGSPRYDLANGQTFKDEMSKHGIKGDLQEIQRFNHVLMSRSIDVAEESLDTTMTKNLKPPKLLVKKKSTLQLPFQRRLRSASPPRLQICTENYIVYS